jgi:hypothetical protein
VRENELFNKCYDTKNKFSLHYVQKNLRWNETQIKCNNKYPRILQKCMEEYLYDFDVGSDLKINDKGKY